MVIPYFPVDLTETTMTIPYFPVARDIREMDSELQVCIFRSDRSLIYFFKFFFIQWREQQEFTNQIHPKKKKTKEITGV